MRCIAKNLGEPCGRHAQYQIFIPQLKNSRPFNLCETHFMGTKHCLDWLGVHYNQYDSKQAEDGQLMMFNRKQMKG